MHCFYCLMVYLFVFFVLRLLLLQLLMLSLYLSHSVLLHDKWRGDKNPASDVCVNMAGIHACWPYSQARLCLCALSVFRLYQHPFVQIWIMVSFPEYDERTITVTNEGKNGQITEDTEGCALVETVSLCSHMLRRVASLLALYWPMWLLLCIWLKADLKLVVLDNTVLIYENILFRPWE